MASVRREIHIECTPEQAWELVGDPGRLHEWFPINDCKVEGSKRWIYLASGGVFEEDIITQDNVNHRFEYSIVNNPIWKDHLGSVDVVSDGHGHCVVVYGTRGKPDVLALVTVGAADAGLRNAKKILEDKYAAHNKKAQG